MDQFYSVLSVVTKTLILNWVPVSGGMRTTHPRIFFTIVFLNYSYNFIEPTVSLTFMYGVLCQVFFARVSMIMGWMMLGVIVSTFFSRFHKECRWPCASQNLSQWKHIPIVLSFFGTVVLWVNVRAVESWTVTLVGVCGWPNFSNVICKGIDLREL